MPNHVTHRMVITGESAAVDHWVAQHILHHPPKMVSHYGAPEHLEPAFDEFAFETIIPKPACLANIASSSTVSDAIEAITGKPMELIVAERNPNDWHAKMALGMHISFNANHRDPQREADRAERLAKMTPEALEQGMTALAAIDECGYPTWYEWSIANWGTKWGAYSFELVSSEPGRYEFKFDCAWSTPTPVLQKLAELHPTVRFEVDAFDEGWNFAAHGVGEAGAYVEEAMDASDTMYTVVYGQLPERDEDEDEDEADAPPTSPA